MFCPKCATQNIDGASFCRVCGANISQVPQALAGQLIMAGDHQIEQGPHTTGRRRKRQPSLAEGIQGIMNGLGFVVVAILVSKYAPAGGLWWYWLLIPAFTSMGKGIADIVRARQLPAATQLPRQQMTLNSVRQESLPAASTGRLVAPPPSVTEGTTRHLGAEAPTRHLDASGEVPK